MFRVTNTRTKAGPIVIAATGLTAGLVCMTTGGSLPTAQAEGVPAVQASQSGGVSTSNLLQFDDLADAGLAVDSATIDNRGDQYLGDAGRFDEGCLWEKTMRNITGAKDYPARGTARAYADGTWESTLDKDVWLRQALTEARTPQAAARYVHTLTMEVDNVKNCEQDPDQGNYYGPAHTLRRGTATITYYVDHLHNGHSDGGGTAIIRDRNRVGFLDLMAAPGKPGTALRKLSIRAAAQLD